MKLVTEPSVRVPAPTPEERHRAAAWFRLVPLAQVRSHPWLTRLAIAVYGLCVLGMFAMQERVIHQSAESIPCPVTYPKPWKTDKAVYRTGDLVRFSYERRTSEGDLLLWDVGAWENLDTEELYPEPISGRYVAAAGVDQAHQVRSLPVNLTPGTYRLRGWISAQSSRRSRPTGYASQSFRVVRREPSTPRPAR